MTVNNLNILSGPYLGNGVADLFAYTFRVSEKTDLTVYMTDNAGIETVLDVDTDYTVDGIGDPTGGDIQLTAPLPVDYLLVIKSNIPALQQTNFSSQGAFFPEIHEAAFDKLTRLVQQVGEQIERCLQVTPTVGTYVDTELPPPVARRALMWNETGDTLTVSGSDPDIMVDASAASAASAALSAGEAAASAGLADGYADEAAASAGLADGSADDAATARDKAQQWADENKDVEVEVGKYSAKHWALSAEEVTAGKEPGLGNPDEDGKVLSSTAAGVRSWVGMIPGVPTGAVLPFAQESAPDGWLKCNGAAVSRTTYATLFAAIGETYGAGDGSTTFLLPDLRGEFVRGWDDARGVDAARAIGTSQADAFQGHYHEHMTGTNTAAGGQYTVGLSTNSVKTGCVRAAITDGTNGGPRTAAETRPRNVALLYCIKF